MDQALDVAECKLCWQVNQELKKKTRRRYIIVKAYYISKLYILTYMWSEIKGAICKNLDIIIIISKAPLAKL